MFAIITLIRSGRRVTWLALCLALFLPTGIVLAGSTTKVLSTNFTLVNLSSTTNADVTALYFKADGSVWDADNANESFTIPMNFGQKIIAQYFDGTLSSGAGSVVISSTAPVGSVVQVQARGQTPTMGAYSGLTLGSAKYYVPTVIRQRSTASGLCNSQIVIQNTGGFASNAVTVNFVASPGSGFSNWTKTGITIAAYASNIYDVADESASNLPDGWYGSAVVNSEASKQIAVVANLFCGPDSLQTFNAFPQESPSTGWSVPLFTSRLSNGLSTPVSVMNLSGSEIAIDAILMSCQSTVSSPSTFTARNASAIPNNASFAFNPVVDMTLPANWTGACRITSPANVVAFVQMRKPGVTSEAAAYEAFRSDGTDTQVVIPLVSKRQLNGFATAVTIQNLDPTNAAYVHLTYTPSADYVAGGGSATPIEFNRTIAGGGNLVQNHRLVGDVPELPTYWYGTLLVEAQPATTARPLAAFVQLTNYLAPPGDTLMAHNAFSLP